MTTSIREQITASVFSLLQNTTGVGGRVYRGLHHPIRGKN